MRQKTLFSKSSTTKKRLPGPKLTTKAKYVNKSIVAFINRREGQILVHSYLYYRLDENLIQDHVFDKFCRELVELMHDYPKEFKASLYYNDFINFDGSTGYDLNYMQTNIVGIGNHLLKMSKGALTDVVA